MRGTVSNHLGGCLARVRLSRCTLKLEKTGLFRPILVFACASALLISARWTRAQSATTAPSAGKSPVTVELAPPPKPLLPKIFAGWEMSGTPRQLTDATQADGANVDALKEYGFTHGAVSTY